MKRSARLAGYIATGMVVGALVAVILIMSLTQSDWGMQRVRNVALGWLKARVQGEVRIARITGGGLLHGAMLHDVSIVGKNGRPFFNVDSAEVSYDWRTLAGGAIKLSHVRLFHPTIHLEQLPGDTAWNYQHIFEDTTANAQRRRPRRLIQFDNVQVDQGTASVLYPLPTPFTARDTARIITERINGSLARVMRFDSIGAQLSRVLWETPVEPGRMFDVSQVRGRAFVYRVPVHVAGGTGRVTMRDTVVSFNFPDVRLPSSHGALLGRVVMEEGRNVFDVQVSLDNFAFHDLDWLYDRLPAQGGGSGSLRIRTLSDGTLFLAENARLTTPGTNVAGTFGIVVGDSVYFTQVDLRAAPLNVDVIKRMLPNGLPIDGLLMGTVELKGSLSSLQTSGNVTIASHGVTSAVKWIGSVDATRRTIGRRGITAEVRDFDLGLLRAMQPRFTLAGRVTGRIDASQAAGGGVRIDANVQHRGTGGDLSTFTGGGLLLGATGSRALDMEWNAESISLSSLALQYPALRGLQGVVSGPVHLSGPLDDLTYTATLATAGGSVDVTGWLRRTGTQPRYGGEAHTAAFSPERFDQRLPTGNVSGRFAFDLAGTGIDNLAGVVRADFDSARIAAVPLQHSFATAHLGDGILRIDTLNAATAAGDITARGAFGLVQNRTGRIDINVQSQALEGIEADLFGPAPAAEPEKPRIAGSVRGSGSVEGSIYGADVHAAANIASAVAGPLQMSNAALTVNGRMFDSTGAVLHAAMHADTVTAFGHRFRVADADVNLANHESDIVATAGDSALAHFRLGGRLADNGGNYTFHLADLTLGATGAWTLDQPADIAWQGDRIDFQPVELHDPNHTATADAVGALSWNGNTQPMTFHFGLHAVPVAEFLRVVHRDIEGAGNIEGTIEVSGTAASPSIKSDLAVTALQYGDLKLDRLAGTLNYVDNDLMTSFDAEHQKRRVLYGGGHAPVDLRFTHVEERLLSLPLSMSFTADSLPLALPLGALQGFTDVNGRLDGTITANGTSLDPALAGGIEVRDGAATWDATGVHYYGVTGKGTLVNDRVVDVLAQGRAGMPRRNGRSLSLASLGAPEDGSANVSGRLDFTELTDPSFDLTLNASRLLAAKRREADVTMTGSMQLGGHYRRPEVTGEVTIDEGSLYLDEVYKRYLVVELDPSLLFNVIDTSVVAVRRVLPVSDNPFLKNLLVDNAVVHVSPRDAWLRSRDLDVLVGGDITVALDRRDADLRMSGSLAVLRGSYNLSYPPLQARRFQVREGTIEFPGTPGIDPNLSITAAYRAPTRSDPLDILAIVTGTLQTPRVRLSSDAEPPISESDLASYLFFGVPSWQVASFANGGNGGFGADLGLRTFAPSVLGYAASGLQTIGERFGLLDYVGISAAEAQPGDIALNNALTNFIQATQIDVGRYVTQDVYVGVTKRFTGTLGARVEWRYSPTYTAQMFWEDRFTTNPSFSLQQGAGFKRVAGFFLFREWGY